MNLKAMILGCGNIAGDLDNANINTTRRPLTHVKAYRSFEFIDVIACIEPNEEKRYKFQNDWSLDSSFSSIEEAISKKFEVDIISICSPTEMHGDHLKKVLSLNPRLVFCEKPLHSDVIQANNILDLYRQQNVHLMVNYSRRFDPKVVSFKESISSGEFGQLRAVSGWYNKGLLNNGSHLLDILIFLFGDLFIEYVGEAKFDYNLNDASHPLVLSTGNDISIDLSIGNANDFSLVELEFLFSNSRVKMLNGGRQWSIENVISDPTFKGYNSLGSPLISEGGYMKVFQNALTNIYDCLAHDKELISSGEDALHVLKLYAEILEKYKETKI